VYSVQRTVYNSWNSKDGNLIISVNYLVRMAFGVTHYVIATRFMITMGHLTSLLLLFSTIENNVNLSFTDSASDAEKTTAYNSCVVSVPLYVIHV
jgi:uncharacterized membrane protein